ncbi:MAG: V-type ATP synthase subunit F [Methanobrevibacter sp.]|jgi:V/A-type H+-transporting ATPase subunit F|nr:V-type ATP synthase subunit F [Methanobrevibacter sp.]
MSSVAVIGDIDTVTGFKLGGIKRGFIVETDEEAKEALGSLINKDKIDNDKFVDNENSNENNINNKINNKNNNNENKDEIAIIIITEKIADNIREYIDKKIGSDVLPMIIEIPDKSGPSDRTTDPMGELIKRVIGVEMVK